MKVSSMSSSGENSVISKAIALGYLVDSKAYAIITKLPPELDPSAILDRVINSKKTKSPSNKVITEDDLREFLPQTMGEMVFARDEEDLEPTVEILSDPSHVISPVEAGRAYKELFLDRYNRLLSIVKTRPDMRGIITLAQAKEAPVGKQITVAGLVASRRNRKGKVEITIDDPTENLRVVCNEEKLAGDTLTAPLDSLIVVSLIKTKSGQFIATDVRLPDVAERRPITSSHVIYAVLLSDLHVGSRMFLYDDFVRFLYWINGKSGDLDIVRRIRYLVIGGDLVDGIGVYPNQELQLSEKSIRNQYALAFQLIEQIPKTIQVLITPGNHDAVRQALPQPSIPADVAGQLYNLDNVRLLGNPAYIKLSGVEFLVYHGKSLDDIISTTPDLSYKRPTKAMEVLIRARHLAPTYGKRTSISPETRDLLVIASVPDVFHCGHVHTFDVANYRGTLLVNSGTFQSKTMFQANMGVEPTPSIIPIINLSDLSVVVRNFAAAFEAV